MKTLSQIVSEKAELNEKLAKARSDFKDLERNLLHEIKELEALEGLAVNAILDIEKVQIAKEIISVSGNPENNCDGEVIADLACIDIANGCKHLRKQYFGNKRYEGFYQRNDCQYGYGPRHGSICDKVGMSDKFRDAELTDEQKDACIYYLKNLKKIRESVKETLSA